MFSAITCAVFQGRVGNFPALLNAGIHILPASILLAGKLFRPSGYPALWPRWLVIAGVVIAATVLLRTPVEFGVELRVLSVIGLWLSDVTLFPALLILILALLPPALSWLANGIQRIPVAGRSLGRWLTASMLYVLLLAGWMVINLYSIDKFRWVDWFFGIAALAMALVFRTSLFSFKQDTFLWRLVPHVPAWLILLFTTVLGDGTEGFSLSLLILPPILAARRLRRDPVPALDNTGVNRSDSIQSKVAHYVDVNGQSARLVRAVGRSDAGVFGVTGVRGAGKSALTRHVLAKLAPHYFTLEVTAPVRHDPGLGFFVSVCKSVCSKTLDALEPIVTGTRVTTGEKLWDKLRNPLLAMFALLGVLSLQMQFESSLPESGRSSFNFYEEIEDPLLGSIWRPDGEWVVAQTERVIIDSLIAQVASAIDDETKGHGTGGGKPTYLLVPAINQPGFWLLPTLADMPAADRLRAYKANLGAEYPGTFYEFHRDSARHMLSRLSMNSDSIDRYTSDIQTWENFVFYFLMDYKVFPPLAYLQPALRYHVQTLPKAKARRAPSSGWQENSKSKGMDKSPPKLLSQMVWNAFDAADVRLEYDSQRLRQFNDVLRTYRRMLNGELGVTSTKVNVDGSTTTPVVDAKWKLLLDGSGSAIVFWTCAGLFMLTLLMRPAWQAISGLTHAIVNRRYLDLYADATDFLEQLSYQSNQEASAGLSWQGVSFGRKRTLAARDLTLPGLTARYTRFLAKLRTAYNGKVVIVIDELDKIHDPEQVKALLVEMKGALFVEGTFYLISISEDAARSFRSRLASGRDIFESTFDDVVEIRQMRVDSALAMLEKLEESVPEAERLPQVCLEVAALFGGGIPREIIRARRVLSYALATRLGPSPQWATYTLLHEEIEHWATHLGEANVSGADTIRLRKHAQQATSVLDTDAEATDRYRGVWDALSACVAIIDPSDLRHKLGYKVDGTHLPADENQAELAKSWQRIQSDLQTLLRLMILVHLSEQIVQPGSERQTYETAILGCHRALADKPALAESMLLELRAQIYPPTASLDEA